MALSYIHGYSSEEQRRLVEQSAVLAPQIYRGLDFSSGERLLELGCGTGAELHYLRARWPHLKLVGIDRHGPSLTSARKYLADESVVLIQGDGVALPFPDQSFDFVLTVWMLEHVHEPEAVLREALRVLRPAGKLLCTEVDNATLHIEPQSPVIEDWICRFNRVQQSSGGDPYVGRRLATLAHALGARQIRTETLPILSTQLEPERRGEILNYLENLLLSGSETLIRAGEIQASRIHELRAAFRQLHTAPDAEARYFAVRLGCQPHRCAS